MKDKNLQFFLKGIRENGDYGIFSLIDEDDAKESIKEAREFLAETEFSLSKKHE